MGKGGEVKGECEEYEKKCNGRKYEGYAGEEEWETGEGVRELQLGVPLGSSTSNGRCQRF